MGYGARTLIKPAKECQRIFCWFLVSSAGAKGWVVAHQKDTNAHPHFEQKFHATCVSSARRMWGCAERVGNWETRRIRKGFDRANKINRMGKGGGGRRFAFRKRFGFAVREWKLFVVNGFGTRTICDCALSAASPRNIALESLVLV